MLREKGFEVEAKLERGVALPSWYLDEPVPDEGTRVVVGAFWELSTERPIGWVPGYIPQSAISSWAVQHGLEDGMLGLFTAAVRACDDEYLSWATRRRSASAPSATDPKK